MIATTLMFSWIAAHFLQFLVRLFSPRRIEEEKNPEGKPNSSDEKDLTDNEKPEVQIPEPLSHPQQDAPEVEIGNPIKKIAALLVETEKPDEPSIDQTDAEKPEVLMQQPLSYPWESAIAESDPEIIAHATHQSVLEALIETDERTGPDAAETAAKNFKFKVTEFPILPDGYYVTLRLDEPENGKIKKTKIFSTRNNPQWDKKSLSFVVQNPKEAIITCKLKRMAVFGLMLGTERKRKTKLEGLKEEKPIHFLRDFRVEPFDAKNKKKQLAPKKREETQKRHEKRHETPKVVLMPQPLSHPPELDSESAIADPSDPKIIAQHADKPSGIEALIETELRTGPDAVEVEKNNSAMNFTFKVIKFPVFSYGDYVSLSLNEYENGKIKKKKILSNQVDPKWNHQSFSFHVQNPEEATITCKIKKMAVFGLIKTTERMRTTRLKDLKNGKILHLLKDFKVAVVKK